MKHGDPLKNQNHNDLRETVFVTEIVLLKIKVLQYEACTYMHGTVSRRAPIQIITSTKCQLILPCEL